MSSRVLVKVVRTINLSTTRRKYASSSATRPAQLAKPIIDLKHIRESPGLYETNCIQRNYPHLAKHSWKILELTDKWTALSKTIQHARSRRKQLSKEIGRAGSEAERTALITENSSLATAIEAEESVILQMQAEIDDLAVQLPNLSLTTVPVGDEPDILESINAESLPTHEISHVDIGTELGIIDISSAAPISGRGFYFLTGAGVLLEQALVQHALRIAREAGFKPVVPPSMVYGYLSSACGFQPRDQDGRQQVYAVEGSSTGSDAESQLVLAGTSEIPLAGMLASKTLNSKDVTFPVRKVGVSRCFRAEAGSRGRDTKGLYRVHEFTKVELFSWVNPPVLSSPADTARFSEELEALSPGEAELATLLEVQKKILAPLGLPLRVQMQPSTDLGASAACKIDIETFFPSRRELPSPWGELSSLSLCTDYQTRRLHTRIKLPPASGKAGEPALAFPHTLNGTALAIPRVIAALLENGWDEATRTVKLPECLWDFMGAKELVKE
jgi:seryl-tRNA synthetase